MIITVGEPAPDFEQDTANGSLRFHAWLGGAWCVLFSHPRKFSAAFAAELTAAARLAPEWARRGVKLVALSPATAEGQLEWLVDLEATRGCMVDFPLVADSDHAVARLYGLAAAEDPALFVIDPARRIRIALVDTAGGGRDFEQILHAIDRLQQVDGPAAPAPHIPRPTGR